MNARVVALVGVGLLAGGAVGEEELRVTKGMALVAEPVLYYESCGRGQAVVLIHGGNLDCRMWEDQFRLLGRDFQVIRYDVRTYGKSEMPTRPCFDVNDLLGLLDTLKVDKAHLVGLSLGGRIALDFALEHPDRVRSLVLVGPGLSGFEWPAEAQKRSWDLIKLARDYGPEKAVEAWLKDPYMVPAMENPALAPRVRQLSMDNAKSWLANPLLEQTLKPPAAGRLAEVKVPTLLVVGSRDVPEIQSIVKLLEKGISRAKKVVIEGSGHLVNMEKPEAFNRVVLGFLKASSS